MSGPNGLAQEERDRRDLYELVTNQRGRREQFERFGVMPDGVTQEEDRPRFSRLEKGLRESDRAVRRLFAAPNGSGCVQSNETLPFAPLSDALAQAPTEPEWLWDGYLSPESLVLLASKPKVGKSTFLFGLFAALEHGTSFLGRATRRTGALLLSEERAGTLAEKARRFQLGDRVHLLMRHQAREHQWGEVAQQAIGYCHENELGLLVVDTFDKWTGLRSDAENNAGAVLEALEPLQQVASAGIGVLISAHQRKADGKHGDAVRGSNALAGGVDVITELERPPAGVEPTVRVLRSVSRYDSTPEELAAELEDHAYAACGDLDSLRAKARTEQVRHALEEIGEATVEEITERLDDVSKDTVRRSLGQLVDAGEAQRRGVGRKNDPYRWTRSFDCTHTDPLAAANNSNGAVPAQEALPDA